MTPAPPYEIYKQGLGYILRGPYVLGVPGVKGNVTTEYLTLDSEMLFFRTGYQWNGDNVVPDHPCSIRASLGHDGLYQLIALGYLPRSSRKAADEFYRNTCIEDGMKRWKAWVRYYTLRAVWTVKDCCKSG